MAGRMQTLIVGIYLGSFVVGVAVVGKVTRWGKVPGFFRKELPICLGSFGVAFGARAGVIDWYWKSCGDIVKKYTGFTGTFYV
jgi:hypothetical protein